MSKLEDRLGLVRPRQPHCAAVLLLDTSGSMSGEKITALNRGIAKFRKEIVGDEGTEGDALTAKRVDLAVITFGEELNAAHDFSSLQNLEQRVPAVTGPADEGLSGHQ